MARRFTAVAALAAAFVLLSLSAAPDAGAHERRTIGGGKYNVVVGWLNEPSLLEEPNAISLTVANAQTNEPVEGVEKTLKVDATAGGQTKTFDLAARFGVRGAYVANLIPTKAGGWVFRFRGDIEGTPIDERFESGPGRFNDVEPKAALEFPAQVPSIGELASQVQPGAQSPAQGTPEAQRALDRADSARTAGLTAGAIGIALGLIGVALAAYALRSRGRSTQPGERGEPI